MTSFLTRFFANVSASGHALTNNIDPSFLISQNASSLEFGIGTAIQYSTNNTTTTVWYGPSLLHFFDGFPVRTGMTGDWDWLSDFNLPINDSLSWWDKLQDPVWSNDSTRDSKPDSKPVRSVSLTTEASEAAPASALTFTTHGSPDSVYLAFVPALKPKHVRSIGLASQASHISPVVVSLRSNGSVNSVNFTSTVQPEFRRRVDFGRGTKLKITPTLVLSSLAHNGTANLSQFSKRPASTKSSASHVLASSSQVSVQPAPTLVLRSSSTAVPPLSPHATPSTSARKPKDDTGPSGSTSRSKHSSGTSNSSNRRRQAAGEVVNKLTQYVEVSEGPLYMFPKYGGAIVSMKEKKLKPTGTLGTTIEEGPSPTSTNAQSASQPRHYSTSQTIKPPETSSSSTALESKPFTATQPTPTKSNNQPGQSKSSGPPGPGRPRPQLPFTPRPPRGYRYVAYEELPEYYYVLYEDGQGKRLGMMILKMAQ